MVLGKLFKSRDELDLTSGKLSYNLFYLSLPIVVINLLRTAYNITDTFWLGRLSSEALAAITFAFPVVFLLISFGMGLVVAGSVLVAQNEGSDRRGKVNKYASQTVTYSLFASVLLGVAGYFTVESIFGFFGASQEVLPLATGYMQVISIGIFTIFLFNVFIALMRGFGDTITPMILMGASVGLNILLDPFLIFGWWVFPQMGIQGAALATVFSRGLAAFTGLAILYSGRMGVEISFSQMVPDPGFMAKLLRVGIPASAESIGSSLSVNALMWIVGGFSTAVVASFGVSIRVYSLIFLPSIALGKGVETMVGQNLGAGNPGRAEKINYMGAKFVFLLMTALGFAVFLGAETAVSVFTSDADVIRHGADFLRMMSLFFGFSGMTHIFRGSFRGAGKTAVAAAISILTLAGFRFTTAYFASDILGPSGIWIAFPVSFVAGAVIAYLWFRKGSWKQSIVEEDRQKGEVAEELSEYGDTITDFVRGILRVPGLKK